MYAESEKQEFRDKDLRITGVAIIKSLIESGRNSANEIKENCEITGQYVNYLYGELKRDKKDQPVVCSDKAVLEVDWKQEAESMDVPIPTKENIKVLLSIMEEYKKYSVVEISPNNLLATIYKAYNKYPTNKASTSKILELF